QAADHLKQLLAQNPDSAEAHGLLALCLSYDRDQWHEATREAQLAVHLAPDEGFSHYALAVVLEKRNRLPEALKAAQEALRIDSYNVAYYALAASVHAQQAHWQDALDMASQGMAIDPDSSGCATIRSLALERLGRTQDASAEADAAVARNPDSAEAHAMRGWTQMQNGKYKDAQNSFRESLRLDPTYEFARSGMIQALNNNHLLFRLIFRFYSFVGRQTQAAQWALIIGLFVGMRVLRAMSVQYPSLQPYVTPISLLYLSFCLLSWIANPLFNTFLRFHPFGKYLLSNKQKWSSNLIASSIVIGLALGILQAVRGDVPGAVVIFLTSLFLTLPVATIFDVDEGWPMWIAIAAALILGLLCFSTQALIIVGGPWPTTYMPYILGILLFSFAGNYLRSITAKH
ncbi:MAG: tetratricopeptide repeat protein, partial [Aureliella sp.]